MKKPVSTSLRWRSLLLLLLLGAAACKKEDATNTTPIPTPTPAPAAFDINSITDTYANVAAMSSYAQWGGYNVHDPAVIKADDEYYS